MEKLLVTLILFTLIFNSCKCDLQLVSQEYLDPANDPETTNTSTKEQDKRTIFSPTIHNVAWAKHVAFTPTGGKQIIGFGPVDLKYTPVIRPLGIKHYGYHYDRPRVHFHVKRPVQVFPNGWKPLLKPARPLRPDHHVDSLHLSPVPHIDHIHHADHLHLNPAPHLDHVHHTDHLHLNPVPHVHAVPLQHVHVLPRPLFPRPLVPSVFEVTKPDLGVLPLGAVFPSPVIKEIPAPRPVVPLQPVLPAPITHLHPVAPVQHVHQVPVQHLHPVQPEPIQHVHPAHVHNQIEPAHFHLQQGHVHALEPHVHQTPIPHFHQGLVPHAHQELIPHAHQGLIPHAHQGLIPQVHHLEQPHIHQAQIQPHLHQAPIPHIHPSEPHLHQAPIPHIHPSEPHIHQAPVPHAHPPPGLPVIPQVSLPPGVSVEYHGNTNFVNHVKTHLSPGPQPALPNHFHLDYPQIPQHFQPQPQAQPLPNDSVFPNQNQAPINNQVNFNEAGQNVFQQNLPERDNTRYQPADQVSTQQFYRGPQSIEQLDQAGYYYPKPEDNGNFIEPGRTDVQLPLQLPQHPGFQSTQRQDQKYSQQYDDDQDYDQGRGQDEGFQESRGFKPSIQLEPPYKK